MADLADVENALVVQIAAAVYPAGPSAPSAVVVGSEARLVRIYRGWPNAPALEADLAQGALHITVFPEAVLHKLTTRFSDRYKVITAPQATLSVSVNGNGATFAGTAGLGQYAGLIVGQATFPYVCQAGDTPSSVAAALAAAARETGLAASASGATLTVASASTIAVRIAAGATTMAERRRQLAGFRLSFWCPDPQTRDAAAAVVDPLLAAVDFLTLADGSAGRLLYVRTEVLDSEEVASLYRRDLLYTVEYPTTAMLPAPPMVFAAGTIAEEGSVVATLRP